MISFKSYKDLANSAFYYCHIVDCELEAEKLYSTETSLRDVCLKHYKELIEKDYE
jgi:hypothetical protein